MASVDNTAPPPQATTVKPSELQPEKKGSWVVDVSLRVLLFATALVAVVVMVTSKQTKLIPVLPGIEIALAAKFDQSPAFIYYVAALSVACLYSIITVALSLLGLKPGGASTLMLRFYFLILDALLFGIVAAATGAAGGVGYIGYKGNSHTRWNKVCDTYDSFCTHFAASIFLSLISCVTLLLLVWLSVHVLYKNITRG